MSSLEGVLEDRKIVPIIKTGSEELARLAVEVLVEEGFCAVEILSPVPGCLDIVRRYSGSSAVKLGVGTITGLDAARAAIESGAEFLVSPHCDPSLVRELSGTILYIPGCATVTEITSATAAGASVCKLFPAETLGGPRFIRMVRVPLPDVRLFPTGGVTLGNLKEYLQTGVFAVGMTSLIDWSAFEIGRVKSTKERIAQALRVVAEFRGGSR